MNIRGSFFLDCSPCVISTDKAGPTMKAETHYNTDYSKNDLFEQRAKLYSCHSISFVVPKNPAAGFLGIIDKINNQENSECFFLAASKLLFPIIYPVHSSRFLMLVCA